MPVKRNEESKHDVKHSKSAPTTDTTKKEKDSKNPSKHYDNGLHLDALDIIG
ncbi:MAG TPA: hypothetical protein VFC84_09650 [Desulfosporosinus sp.]|nr:hypothetical protein [Desulfosporosinus sp.]